MAKSQKSMKGWEIVLGEKAESRHLRQKISSRNSGITLCRTSDRLELREGDSIRFNLNRNSDYKITGYGFIKDISFAVDKFLAIRILWFVRFDEKLSESLPSLPSGGKYFSNELFLTPFLDSIMLEQIVDKIDVIGIKQLHNLSENLDLSSSSELKNVFICRRFTDDSSTYFTDLVDWSTMVESFKENKDEFYDTVKLLTLKPKPSGKKIIEVSDDPDNGNDLVTELKPKRKTSKKIVEFSSEEEEQEGENKDAQEGLEDFIVDDSDEDALLDSDSSDDEGYHSVKKGSKAGSPRKKRVAKTTRRSPRKRRSLVPELPLINDGLGMLADEESSTTQLLMKAKRVLGTGAELRALPCREDEFYQLYHRLEDAILSQNGCCIYVSGTPGVGKTATIREVIQQLSAKMTIDSNGVKMFNYVEINGLKLIKPQSAYEVLWKKISGNATSTSNSLTFLQQHFENVDEEEKNVDEYTNKLPLVVLLDELDQIATRNQAVMYNFFNWPTYENSRLIVVAVANTMDLPERLLTNKISSRLGLLRIQFTSYSYNQLSEIIKHRLEQLSKHNDKLLIAKDAIEFASRKVASVSGDARRSLMICIRAVEIAEAEFMSKSEAERKELDGKYTVTIMHIMKAVNETSSSPVAGYLNSISFLSKLVLASIMLRKKRSGIAEIQVGEVYDEVSNQVQVLLFSELKNRLKAEDLQLLDIVFGQKNSNMSGSVISASLFILKDLEENGILMMQPLRMERNRLIRLNISDDEILNSFKRDSLLKEIVTFI